MSVELPVVRYHSYTSNSTFEECREKHYLRYVEKLHPVNLGASLFFGSAVEQAVNHLLSGVNDSTVPDKLLTWKEAFHEGERGWDAVLTITGVKFSEKDLDKKLLNLGDSQELLQAWEKSLNVSFDSLDKKDLSEQEQELKDKVSWLSLRNKAYLMVEAFIDAFLPKVTEVITIQHALKGEIAEDNGTVNAVSYIDLVCRHKDYDRPIIFDIKTSAMAYEPDSIIRSAQLGIYSYGLSEELPDHLVGYLVLLKTPVSDAVCKLCGKQKNSSHRTCNNEVNSVRCNGEWDTVYKGAIQVLVGEIPKDQQKEIAQNFVTTASLADQGLRGRNRDACRKYGMCDYYKYCLFGDSNGIYKKGK